jgi:hypothetical protein
VARIVVARIAVRSAVVVLVSALATLRESPVLDPFLGSHISDPFGAPYLDQNPNLDSRINTYINPSRGPFAIPKTNDLRRSQDYAWPGHVISRQKPFLMKPSP